MILRLRCIVYRYEPARESLEYGMQPDLVEGDVVDLKPGLRACLAVVADLNLCEVIAALSGIALRPLRTGHRVR